LASIDVRCRWRRDLLVWSKERSERKLAGPSISERVQQWGPNTKPALLLSKAAIVRASASSLKPASKQGYNGCR